MSTLSPKSKAASKLIVKACCVADRRRAAQLAPEDLARREAGRYAKSLAELSEAVEKYRKCGGQP